MSKKPKYTHLGSRHTVHENGNETWESWGRIDNAPKSFIDWIEKEYDEAGGYYVQIDKDGNISGDLPENVRLKK